MKTAKRKSVHERFMAMCLALAEKGKGRVSPNPLVGAALVRDGRVIARGYHRRFGSPHAEAECIRRARGSLRNATLYVNLEPCVHHGKTPPCVDLIVASGIRRVVAGMQDPNPIVAGRGIRKLRRNGIRVTVGVLREEAESLNRRFIRHITRRRPYVHVKIAQSLDGMIARRGVKRGVISSRRSRELVHRWRAEYDAVMVGGSTIRTDDPRLTVRLAHGRDPAVIILDGRLSVPSHATVFRAGRERSVYLCATRRAIDAKKSKALRLEELGVQLIAFPERNSRIPLRHVFAELYKRNIASILVEGGRDVFSQVLRDGPLDELSIFVSPKLIGDGVPSVAFPGKAVTRKMRLGRVSSRPSGNDLLLTALFD